VLGWKLPWRSTATDSARDSASVSSGFAGLGKGWDDKMRDQIKALGNDGYVMVSAVQQKDPTWFILFFKRQSSGDGISGE
jgi:hypothetical protein